MANVNIINGRLWMPGTYLLLYVDRAGVFNLVNSQWPDNAFPVPVYLRISGAGNELTITGTLSGYSSTVVPIQDGPDCVPFLGAAAGLPPFILIEYPSGTVTSGPYTDTLTNIFARATGGSDPYFSSVKLLLGSEGADASTTIADEGPLARGNATVTGNAQIDTALFKFGAASLLLDGTGDKITFADSADWQFDGQFTVEAWINVNSFATATTSTILSHGASSVSYGWWFTYSNAGTLRFRFDDNGDGVALHDLQQVAGPISTGQWYHVAVDRDAASTMRLYVNGVMRASKASATGTSFDSPNGLDIGYIGSSTTFTVNGWIDEVRITKGVARYATDTSFTVPAAAFPRS